MLPAANWLEQDDIADLHFIWYVQVRQKVIEIGECWDGKQILIELARRPGLERYFPCRNVREYRDWVLKDSAITFDEFKELSIITGKMRYRKCMSQGFATRSGKFEIYSAALAKRRHDPLPSYTEPPESPINTPELPREYPLIAIAGCKLTGYSHSEGRQISSLRRLHPDPLVEIHPDTAGKLDIRDGDWVWVESPRARIRQRARLTPGIHPRVIHAEHGWWFPEREAPEYEYKESSANLLLDNQACEPVMGAEAWKGFLCRVYKA